ncbi:membrane protein [soil metagenome]
MFARRFSWYVRALGPNPLVRVSDRLEAFAVLTVFVAALIAVPFAALAGDQVRETGMRDARIQASTRHFVNAVVVVGSSAPPSEFDGPAYVRAQWHEGTQLRTENVISPETVQAGDPLKLWLDERGKVVPAPVTADDVDLAATSAAVLIWAAVVSAAALTALTIRMKLDRSRDRAWERELQLMAHNDDGWANRHI